MHSIWWNGLHRLILRRNLWYFVRWCCHLGNQFTTPSLVLGVVKHLYYSHAQVHITLIDCTDWVVMGPSFLEGGPIMYRCCPSVPCLHLEKKRKGLRIRNLAGRVPGTWAPRGPISRIPAVAWVGRPYLKASVPPSRGKTKRPTYTKLGRKGPWDTSTPGPITRSRGQRSRSRRLIALFAKKSS